MSNSDTGTLFFQKIKLSLYIFYGFDDVLLVLINFLEVFMESAEYFVNNFRGMLAINYEQTAANIRKLRETKLKGMKQCEWQEIFDVSSPTANSWENLTKPKLPGLPRLCVMAKLFGVPLDLNLFQQFW